MIFTMVATASAFLLQSPDKSIEVQLSTDGTRYTVPRAGEEIIAPSSLGLIPTNAAGHGDLMPVEARRDHIERTAPLTAAKAAATVENITA